MEEREWYEDDRPRDYSKYAKMTKEELDAEIARAEAEERKRKQQKQVAFALSPVPFHTFPHRTKC